ncbi:MAG: DUF3231 family protein [Clostridiales bacterium]|nr:DUF3231 family protein [Clostridiales bacterium]MCF8023031.1 DUF3231 family protein [Clostridiales bacterium]
MFNLPSIFKRTGNQPETIDIETAYNIWLMLKTRYESMENIHFLKNFVHDRDFGIYINSLLESFKNQVDILEKEAQKFKIKIPDRPPSELVTSKRLNIVTDKFIYGRIVADLKNELMSLNRTMRTSTTNDRIRDLFNKFLLNHMENFDELYKYGKIKGWETIVPAYKTAQAEGQEPLSLNEAYHLWDHLNLRYDQLQITQFFLSYTHDADLKYILSKGIDTLKKQLSYLEQLAAGFEIPLPQRPPANITVREDLETFEDHFIYRRVLEGIVSAVDLHLRAVVETIRNDELRNIFFNLYKEELNIYGDLLRYGKAKGWTRKPPIYE